MRFSYSQRMQDAFPARISGVLSLTGIHVDAEVKETAKPFLTRATQKLAGTTESALPEIQAWRRAFASMGLKPTQYRCASEALLRRYRKSGDLPQIHPLVDLCNAVSVAYAIPIAVYDCDAVGGDLVVCHAEGDETYLTFGGDIENPEPDEVVFVDSRGHAHARRWCNRQSLQSAMKPDTSRALIVAEALHEGALEDITRLTDDLAHALQTAFGTPPDRDVLHMPNAFYERTNWDS